MFITFYQNNSGGYYIQDENVDVYVIIEGKSLLDILERADSIFEDYREYCECCGERWDDDCKDESNIEDEPMIYGESAYNYKNDNYIGCKIIIYKLNNEKEIIEITL